MALQSTHGDTRCNEPTRFPGWRVARPSTAGSEVVSWRRRNSAGGGSVCALWQVALETESGRRVTFSVADSLGPAQAAALVLAPPGAFSESLRSWARDLARRNLRAYCVLLSDAPSEAEGSDAWQDAWQDALQAVLTRIAGDLPLLPLALVGFGRAAPFVASEAAETCFGSFGLVVAARAASGPERPEGFSGLWRRFEAPEPGAELGEWLSGEFADWFLTGLGGPSW